MANLGGNNSGKLPATTTAPEKAKFSQTCNLLSQYLKERGSFGDINLGINGKIEAKGCEASRPPSTTLNLFSNTSFEQNSVSETKPSSSTDVKPKDFFPKFLGSSSSNPLEDSNTKSADLRKSPLAVAGDSAAAAQMTIFYAGKVMVFDEFSAEKAKEIFDLATKGSPNSTTTTTTTNGFVTSVSGSAMDKSKSTSSTAPPPPLSNNAGEKIPFRPEDRIARRASLHRFFEKRKDRAAAKAPYQVNKPSSPPPPPQQPKPAHDERHQWIDLEEGQSSKQFDLNL